MIRKAIAWVMFLGGLVGFTLSALRIIAKNEPLLVLLLSWAALIYEGANSIFITTDKQDTPRSSDPGGVGAKESHPGG